MTSSSSSLHGFIYSALFAALIIVLGFISIPIGPVPISGINLGVMLAASILSPKRASCSILIVILLGAVGLPVFSGFTGGMGMLLGPRGGYYLGFVVGAYITALCRGEVSWIRLFFANILGSIIIEYAVALPWLVFVTKLQLMQSIFVGFLPFMPGDILKIILTTIFVTTLHKNAPSLFKNA